MKLAHVVTTCIMLFFAAQLKANESDSTQTSIPDINVLLKEILDATGLQPHFTLKEASVKNIEASITKKNRYILYNPEFINWINNSTRSKWATMALLAHEIGHHLNGHTLHRGGSEPQLELEADEYAGFVLNKMGATLEQAQIVMYYIARKTGSTTHPGRSERLLAISRGWHREANRSQENARP